MELFFLLVLITGGFFWMLAHLSARSRVSVLQLFLPVLMVYGGAVAGLSVLVLYTRDLGLLVYAASVLIGLGVCAYLIKIRIWRHPGPDARMNVSYGLVLLAILMVTVIQREAGSRHQVQMDVGYCFSGQPDSVGPGHFWMNVLLFLPLGLLGPSVFARDSHPYGLSIGVGILCSAAIETVQLLFSMGICDVDDVITNTLGCVLGVLLVQMAAGMRPGGRQIRTSSR